MGEASGTVSAARVQRLAASLGQSHDSGMKDSSLDLRRKPDEGVEELPGERLEGTSGGYSCTEAQPFGANHRGAGEASRGSPGRSRGSYGVEKRSVGAAQRDKFLRAARKAIVVESTDASRLVLVDECSTNISPAPHQAWSPKGRRTQSKVLCTYGPNLTLLASISTQGMEPCLAVEGAITGEAFEAYSELILGPAPRPGRSW